MKFGARFHDYYIVTKPGIVKSNAMVGVAAYLFGSGRSVDWWGFIGFTIGTALIIAASCVVNNYLDRPLDARMNRTKLRPSVTGKIGLRQASIYAAFLYVIGFTALTLATNWRTVLLGFTAVIAYVIVYGIAKRRSKYGTLVGSISGAIPPLAGYVAATNRLDMTALLLFLILTAWQMPHFYAIALFRKKDYAAAGVPVWSIVAGNAATVRQIIGYIVLFIIAVLALPFVADMSYSYIIGMGAIAIWWLSTALRRPEGNDKSTNRWAGKVFGQSLLMLVALSILLAGNTFLP